MTDIEKSLNSFFSDFSFNPDKFRILEESEKRILIVRPLRTQKPEINTKNLNPVFLDYCRKDTGEVYTLKIDKNHKAYFLIFKAIQKDFSGFDSEDLTIYLHLCEYYLYQ